MYFFALSHAPPVFEAEIAICTPLTMAPGRKPTRAFGPKQKPSRKGVTVTQVRESNTSRPGRTRSRRAARVLMRTQALQSGGVVPSRMPGFSRICRRTSSIIPRAAWPTDLMVMALKAQGIMEPNRRHENTSGSLNDTSFSSPNSSAVCRNAPYRANPTRVAEPIAKPLPMAAVVFPAESRTSVLCLTTAGSSAISAMPPALSLTGPQLSMARQIGRLESMPRAASATPQKPRVSWAKQQTRHSTTTGTIVEKQPRANPQMMLVAGPILQASESYCTGLQVQLVMISVAQPITSPPSNPSERHRNGCVLVLSCAVPARVILKAGRKKWVAAQRTGSKSRVEKTNCFLRARSTSLGCATSSPSVIRLLTAALTSTPTAGTASTQTTPSSSKFPPSLVSELHPITRAAQVDSANDPKRSAPMPAISPTLSPTLSAIVAGLRGLSSGSPLSILPTKSEPKSAAFVKMPPPTRANRATVDPPRPNPAIDSNRKSQQVPEREEPSSPSSYLQTQMSTSSTSRETATRAKPITTPALQATRKAAPRDPRAQMVVRKLESVAMCMPNAPQAMEVTAPVTKAKVVQQLPSPSTQVHTMAAMMAMNTLQVLYSETMNSVAPSWMMAPISTMPSADLKLMLCSSSSRGRLLPTGTLRICPRLKKAHARPTPTANKITPTNTHINYKQTYPPTNSTITSPPKHTPILLQTSLSFFT